MSGTEEAVAFPFPRLYHWETLIAARAIENQTFVAAANRVGQDGAITFCGSSQILDTFGAKLSACAEVREDLILADITSQSIVDIHSSFNILRDRRPDVYKGL